MNKELLFNRVLDDLGRISLPIQFRKDHGINSGGKIAFYKANNQIILEFGPCCVICKKPESVMQVSGEDICANCAAQIVNNVGA